MPLRSVPMPLRPDREGVVTVPADVTAIALGPGVEFRPLAGHREGARGLTTGIVTLAPSAALSRHMHPCSESITVLEGELEMAVEGRVYRLQPLDNITIPRW